MKAKKSADWRRLDNAAKIFPCTSNKADTKVFRFSCELTEPVDPPTLQLALERALEVFPGYRCTLRRGCSGITWKTVQNSPLFAKNTGPRAVRCMRRGGRGLLFEVTYYRCRINLEVYHALTDGTGAVQFLRVLVYHYLTVRHADRFAGGLPAIDYDASATEKMDDSFRKYYTHTRKQHEDSPNAYRLRGPCLPENHRIAVIEGVMPVKAVLKEAHAYGATLTEFCAAILMCSIEKRWRCATKNVRLFWRCRSICAVIFLRKRPQFFQRHSSPLSFSKTVKPVGGCDCKFARDL